MKQGKRIMNIAVLSISVIFAACVTWAYPHSSAASELNPNANDSACAAVTIGDLNENPEAYEGHHLCLSGYLAGGIYNWNIVGTGPANANLLVRAVNLGIRIDAVEAAGWIEGDVISASGIFQVDSDCNYPESQIARDAWDPPDRCFSILSPFGLESAEVSLTPRSAEVPDCLTLSFEEFATSPLVYAYQPICVDALIQIQFEGMGLYSLSGIDNSERRLLHPSISHVDAARAGLRTRDHVLARGYAIPSERCLRPDSICIGGADFYLRDSTLEFVSRIPARDQCLQIPIASFELGDVDEEAKMICTSGRVAIYDSWYFLVSESATNEVDEERNLRLLTYLFLEPEEQAILPGDVVSIAGLVWRNDMEVYEIDILDRAPIRESCIEASIATIYADPRAFIDQVVCTEGYLRLGEEDYLYLLPDEETEPNVPARTQIEVYAIYPELENRYNGPGTQVSVAALISSYSACQNELSLSELAAAYAEDDYCPPVNVPLTMDIFEIEYLDQTPN